jgi:gas vesicle protein
MNGAPGAVDMWEGLSCVVQGLEKAMWTMELLLGWGITTLVGAFAGSFLGSYMKKKGEDLATKEDFKDLKEQTRELAQTTKEIEAKIDDHVWNRQRQWEMKRDVLIEFARTVSDFEQAVMQISTKVEDRSKSAYQAELFGKALARWNESSNKFERDSFVAGLVVSIETRLALMELSRVLRSATSDILQSQKKEAYSNEQKNIVLKLEIVKSLIREELGIITTATSRSDGSSVVPTPDFLRE